MKMKKIKSDKIKKKSKDKVEKKADLPPIPYQKDDYIIVDHSGKLQLGLVLSKTNLLLEDGVELDETSNSIEFSPESVRANLGQKPILGKVFGINVEPYDRTISVPEWGDLRIYRTKIKREERENLKSALAKAHKILDKHKAFSFVKFLSHIELRSATGKYAGKYIKKKAKDDQPKVDIISINNVPLTDPKYALYVIMHEAAHGIWFRMVPKDIQARWLKLYAKRRIVQAVSDKQLAALSNAVETYDGSINDYIKEMADTEETVILKEVIAHIRKVHKLDRFDLDILYESGNREMLSSLWPVATDIATPTFEPSVYALTNPKEFFAESMSYYLTDVMIPKDLKKACEKTLEALTINY